MPYKYPEHRGYTRAGSDLRLSRQTSASQGGHKAHSLQKYFYFSTPRTDLTNSDLYKNSERASQKRCNVLSKLNQSDCYNDSFNQKTKSVFKISGSKLQQNMYVLPLDQNNLHVYQNTNMDTSSLTRGHVPQHKYEGFRPVLTRHFRRDVSGYQGELSPELREKQLELLEMRYHGSKIAHQAATVIQTAWRDYVLRTKFNRMVNLAKSVENVSLSQRLSLMEIDNDNIKDDASNISPAARHIQSRRHLRRHNGGHMVKRSTSLKDHRRSGSWSGGFQPIDIDQEQMPCDCEDVKQTQGGQRLKPSNSWTESRPQTAADLQNKLNIARDFPRDLSPGSSPVPPCPPLRGRDFYPDQEPVYSFARDSVYCSVRRPRRMPPRPPQRTVSFLGQEQHMSHVAPVSALPPELITNDQRPISVSDSSLPRPGPPVPEHMRTVSTCHVAQVSHNRTQSSPACHNQSHKKISPLPPPPYVPPPSVQHRDPNEPLPPPPPSVDPTLDRPPCDSVSSIDSGFRSSCSDSTSSADNSSQPNSPCQPYPDTADDPYSYWVGSPNIITSPESAAIFYRSTLDSVYRPNHQEHIYEQHHGHQERLPQAYQVPACCCENHHCLNSAQLQKQLNVYDTYQDVYERLGPRTNSISDQNKPKKSVRIKLPSEQQSTSSSNEDSETLRRRQYRVGLNIFNTNTKRGIEYLCKKEFVEYNPTAVAKFLLGRKGLSKKMLGEYICDLQKPFNMAVLHAFVCEMDFSGLHLDIALRQLLAEVSIPGEAQKIEKLVEVFSKRYIECNQMFVSSFKSADAIFILSYAMVLLNTDLHNKSIKPERKMKQEDFLRNLRGVDCGSDIDAEMLRGIYDRIKTCEFKQGSDHVSQVTKVQETVVGTKRPKLNTSWRRLVCFCRVSEVSDVNKKEKKDSHQRGLFLFNDLLVVTKAEKSKKKQLHQHRYSLGLADLKVCVFRTQHFQFGVQLQERHTARIVATFSCRSYNDQQRFVADIQESIAEVDEMERARIFINDAESLC